jgi:restriction system protein
MKKASNRSAEGILFLLALPVGLYFDATRTYTLIVIALLCLFFLLLYLSVSSSMKKTGAINNESKKAFSNTRSKARNKVKQIVNAHIETLARRRIALVRTDEYGVTHGKAWSKEVQHFVDKVIRPTLTDEEAFSLTTNGEFSSIFQELIEEPVRFHSEEIEKSQTFSTNMSPTEFEKWCANELEKKGWKCITTKTTGDQGADVVAEKKIGRTQIIRVVIQCKLWESLVGNKAVQEAHAAKAHYIADYAAVVSNSEFTPSAKQLSQSTKVFLWHFSDLQRIDQLLLGSNS